MTALTSKTRPYILVGGGTGGHIMPLIAIGEELTVRKLPFVYVGGRDSREQQLVNEQNWQFFAIDAGKWRRDYSWSGLTQNLKDLYLLAKGVTQSVQIINKTRACLVFSKGGYVALPMVIAARLKGIPLIIHESDTVMGVTNRFSVMFAKKVLTGFEPAAFGTYDDRYVRVGVPMRKALRQAASLKAPAKTRPLLLVMGGIQGAVAINSYIRQSLPELLRNYDVVHSTGEQNFAAFKDLWRTLPKASQVHYKPFAFISRELPYYYQAADVVVSRASATVIVEAALFKKAMYLIPLPTSAGNHQVINAQLLARAGAVVYKEQYQLTAEVFLKDIEQLMADTARRKELGQMLNSYFSSEESIKKTIEIMEEYAQK